MKLVCFSRAERAFALDVPAGDEVIDPSRGSTPGATDAAGVIAAGWDALGRLKKIAKAEDASR